MEIRLFIRQRRGFCLNHHHHHRLLRTTGSTTLQQTSVVSSFNHFAKEEYHHHVAATPLAFEPKQSSSLLTPLHLQDTASILNPKWVHLSPSFGAALTTSPVIGNLLRIIPIITTSTTTTTNNNNKNYMTDLEQTAYLTNQLFFQMIRESSIHVTRTKSIPAAYLTPKLIGAIVGGSTTAITKMEDEVQIRNFLKKEFGIQSNRINSDQWTGISLTRWLDLFRLTNSNHWLPLSVWLTALWETSSSKFCLLDYLLECDRHVQWHHNESIFFQGKDDTFIKALKRKDPLAIDEWQHKQFSRNDDLSTTNVQASFDRLLFSISSEKTWRNDYDKWMEVTHSLEVICASIALKQIPLSGKQKPTVPNGYFGYDGGDVKADCVEVTIREIIDLLLWDENAGSFDMTRLPSTAMPELVNFYQSLNTKNDRGEDEDDRIGKEWFDMLCDLPGCDYLATSSNNERLYELAPTMENISKVCHRLLVASDKNINDVNSSQTPIWTTLHDLSKASICQSSLTVETDTLVHYTVGNSKNIIQHEIATLQVANNPNCIELRMRCDWSQRSGFSAVTHLRQQPQKSLEVEQIQKFRQCIQHGNGSSVLNTSIPILALALIADVGLLHDERTEVADFHQTDDDDNMTLLLLDLLSTSYGCDRRGIINHCNDDSERQQQQQQQQQKQQQQQQEAFNDNELQKNRIVLKAALYRICDLHEEDPELCKILLSWILQESPAVIESSSISSSCFTYDRDLELTIISLPIEILADEMVQNSLCNNNWGLFRGQLLAIYAQFESNNVSIMDIILGKDLNVKDLISLVSLIYNKK